MRAAVPDDALEVAVVHVRSWQVGYRGLLPQEYLDRLRPQDRARRYTFDRTGRREPVTVVAVEREAIRGFATTGPSRDSDEPGAGELWACYVDPAHWGSGIGHLLIADARSRLNRDGVSEALLWVLVGNERARRFYQADGWVLDGHRHTQKIWDVTADEVRYRRALP